MLSIAMRRHVQTLLNECEFYAAGQTNHMQKALAQLKAYVEEITC
jgi:hypothetical protein